MPAELITPTGLIVMGAGDMYNDHDEWLRLRRYRPGVGYCIGASDAPSILGVKGTGTALKVWLDKVRGLEQPDKPEMLWGRLHEDTIARYWRDLNRSVTEPIGLICHVQDRWAQTTLDRLVVECPLDRSDRKTCALEIKTRGAFGSRRWHKTLPDDVLAQVAMQLWVSGLDHIHYAVLIGGNDYHQGVVRAGEADTAAVVAYVRRQVTAFRSTHLIEGAEREPEWDIDSSPERIIELDALLHPERQQVLEVDDDTPAMQLAQARVDLAAASKREKQAKAALLRQADGARVVTTQSDMGPQLVYEFTPTNSSKVLAVGLERLREKYPHVYADPEIVTHKTGWQIKIADQYKPTAAPEETP